MAEKKVPEHIKKFYDLMDRVEGAIATTDHYHRSAYLAGEETIKEDGVVKHDLLKDRERREKFVDAMAGVYLDAAKQYFHLGKDAKGDDLWEERLRHAYAGVTRSQLRQFVDEHKEKFTFEQFQTYKDKLIQHLQQQLSAIPSQHLERKHIGDILEETGLKDIVDGSKIGVPEAAALLGVYKREGGLPKDALRRIVPPYALRAKDK